MRTVILSVSKQGYVVQVNSVTEKSQAYKGTAEDAREAVLVSLKRGLNYCKAILNHDKLVIELSNKYVYDHILDDVKPVRSFSRELGECVKLLDECDAKVSLLYNSKTKTHSEKFFAESFVDVGEEFAESMESIFEELE